MKTVILLAVLLAATFSLRAETNAMERFSPHLAATTPILWQTGMTNVPNRIWVYRRILPFVFPEAVISNAIVLASLQCKGFPRPTRNEFFIAKEVPANWCCAVPIIFDISPSNATLSYSNPDQSTSTSGIPDDNVILKRGWKCAMAFGIGAAHCKAKNWTSHFNRDSDDNELTNQICGRGVFLSRELDGMAFWGTGDNGTCEGFWIEFGSQGKIQDFLLNWPNLERFQQQTTATPQEIIACIRAHKVIALPDSNEEHYFARLKALAGAKTFTITKITPYYAEQVFGEQPTNDVPSQFIAPMAELEAVADLGGKQSSCRLYAPILSVDVRRLLRK